MLEQHEVFQKEFCPRALYVSELVGLRYPRASVTVTRDRYLVATSLPPRCHSFLPSFVDYHPPTSPPANSTQPHTICAPLHNDLV
jgi:hypothetical protein